MENFICVQCGTQFNKSAHPSTQCPICQDERQFVHHGGQQWTTLQHLKTDHYNRLDEEAAQLLGIGTERTWRGSRDRDIASAFLFVNGRVG